MTQIKKTLMCGGNRHCLKRAADHVQSACIFLGHMDGEDMTKEFKEQRDKCVADVIRAFNAIDDFRYMTDNERVLEKDK